MSNNKHSSAQNSSSEHLAVCHECDALQRVTAVPAGTSLRCYRCGSVILRHPRGGVDKPLALALAAFILFMITNAFPFMSLRIEGLEQEVTFGQASWSLYEAGMWELALVVFLTSVLGPALAILSSLYVLTAIRWQLRLPYIKRVLALISQIQPWGMLDVFMLGVLVSFVKLGDLAEVIIGPGLYSFAALIFLIAAETAAFDPKYLWWRLGNR